MRAVIFRSFGDTDVLEVADVATPEPGPGQVRIAVRAASVHPADLTTRAGAYRSFTPERPAYGLGWDVAGTVDALGADVTGYAIGDAVIGMSDYFDNLVGTQAEYVVLDTTAIAPAPHGVSLAEAATLPLNGLTAAQALAMFGFTAGQTIAITGAAGAVGGFAAELAVHAGLRVFGVAGERDADRIRAIGAVFVPRSADPAAAIRSLVSGGVDGLFDPALVGTPALGAVRDNGIYVNVSRAVNPPAERGIRLDTVLVHSDGTQLAELADLVERDVLTLQVADTLPLADVADAHAKQAKGGVRGRLVLVP
ncbi:MAG TPA: NADP-dependent oxidoreductase [Pseudonocardiaceae bacterium]